MGRLAQHVGSDLVRDALSRGEPLWVRVRSDSMAPTIRAGEEVLVEPLRTRSALPGEVVLVEGASGLVVHRFLYGRGRGEKRRIRTRGDRASALDALVPASALLGRVTWVRSGEGHPSRRVRSAPRRALGDLLRAAFSKLVVPAAPGHRRPVTLAGFPFDLRAGAGVRRRDLAPFLVPAELEGEKPALIVLLDDALDRSDPLTITIEEAEGHWEASSSSFVLREGSRGMELRVAGSVREPRHPCPSSLENGLRTLLLRLCAGSADVSVLHGALVVPPGSERAIIALGASGAGKTTLCRTLLEEGWLIGSDDLVLVRRTPEGMEVRGTPFSGDGKDLPRTQRAFRLAAWAVLEKKSAHSVRQAPMARIAAALAAAEQRLSEGARVPDAAALDRAAERAGMAPHVVIGFAPSPGLGQTLLKTVFQTFDGER